MGELWVDHVSYSQLNMAQECPYQWFQLKALGVEPMENAFAQAGALVHEMLAEWAEGKLAKEDMSLELVRRFARKVTAEFPRYLAAKGYANKLINSVRQYFDSFDEFRGYEIVGVEKEFQSMIAGERFVGVIDLVLRDKSTGGLMIVDHKSASLSTFRKDKEQMYRQLLLYSKYCADTYGTFPENLAFNLFKEGVMDVRPFSAEEYMAARIWAEEMVKEMKRKKLTDWFEVRPDYFRCTNLCSCRNQCQYGCPEAHRKENANGTAA